MAGEDGGGGENNKIVDIIMKDNKNVPAKRIRQYGGKSKGPFIVCIRAINKPLSFMKITKFLHNNYKSNLITKQINEFKMNVTFTPASDKDECVNAARDEANDLPKTEWGKVYRVYIPEKLVEVIGCIAWSTEESLDDILTFGKGKFRNPSMPEINVLDAARFARVVEEEDKTQHREMTNTVRVTFDGVLLPEYLTVYGLLIPVREFIKKQMFCELCLKYNHTKSHCNNKPYKPVANDKKCMHCQVDDHQTGEKSCPRRKFLEERNKGNTKNIQKKTYAEMLQELDPQALQENDSLDRHFPLNLGTKNSRKRQNLVQQKSKNIIETPNKKRKHQISLSDDESSDDEKEERPPGFRNQEETDGEENDITSFIKRFIRELNLPPFITQLIMKFVVPFIDKLVNKFTNSFMEKMSQINFL